LVLQSITSTLMRNEPWISSTWYNSCTVLTVEIRYQYWLLISILDRSFICIVLGYNFQIIDAHKFNDASTVFYSNDEFWLYFTHIWECEIFFNNYALFHTLSTTHTSNHEHSFTQWNAPFINMWTMNIIYLLSDRSHKQLSWTYHGNFLLQATFETNYVFNIKLE